VTAKAIPLATNRLTAIMATSNIARLNFYPSSLFAYPTVSSEVGASGGRRKTHTAHNPFLPSSRGDRR
jgi:hypothetical protein